MKKLIIFAFCGFISLSLNAASRSVEDAAALAASFLNKQIVGPNRAPAVTSSLKLVHTRLKVNSEAPAFYIFDQPNNQGYALVMADDRVDGAVWAYSDHGSFEQALNPGFQFWLGMLQERVSAIPDDYVPSAQANKAPQATEAYEPIAPMLVKDGELIQWDQAAPFNAKCPYDTKGGGMPAAGCSAIAISQLMAFYQWPNHGYGSTSYKWQGQTLSCDFTQYSINWPLIKGCYKDACNRTQAEKDEVADLIYHAGLALHMDYNVNGSGAYVYMTSRALCEHFDYVLDYVMTNKETSTVLDQDSCQTSVPWKTFRKVFNKELEAGRPILISGQSSAAGGHAFICDGRQDASFFHINWGWFGNGDNYCAINELIPNEPLKGWFGIKDESGSFSSRVDAFIGLVPKSKVALSQTKAKDKRTVKSMSNGQIILQTANGQRFNVLGQQL